MVGQGCLSSEIDTALLGLPCQGSLSCTLLFQVTEDLLDHKDPKVCCFYCCSDLTRACLTPGNPNVTHAPVSKNTDDSGSWTLRLGGLCLSDRETKTQRGATEHQHHSTVIGWPLGWRRCAIEVLLL